MAGIGDIAGDYIGGLTPEELQRRKLAMILPGGMSVGSGMRSAASGAADVLAPAGGMAGSPPGPWEVAQQPAEAVAAPRPVPSPELIQRIQNGSQMTESRFGPEGAFAQRDWNVHGPEFQQQMTNQRLVGQSLPWQQMPEYYDFSPQAMQLRGMNAGIGNDRAKMLAHLMGQQSAAGVAQGQQGVERRGQDINSQLGMRHADTADARLQLDRDQAENRLREMAQAQAIAKGADIARVHQVGQQFRSGTPQAGAGGQVPSITESADPRILEILNDVIKGGGNEMPIQFLRRVEGDYANDPRYLDKNIGQLAGLLKARMPDQLEAAGAAQRNSLFPSNVGERFRGLFGAHNADDVMRAKLRNYIQSIQNPG